MHEGRKTRRYGGGVGGKNKEKAKLDREWQQISAVSYRCWLSLVIQRFREGLNVRTRIVVILL